MAGSSPAVTKGPVRSHCRRQRRPARQTRDVVHLVMPGLELARAAPKRRETIAGFLRRTGWARVDSQYGWQFGKGLPTICEIDGEPVLRRDWRKRRIRLGEQLRFTSFPLGGGGGNTKQVIGLVALVAVAAFASVVTGGAAAALLGPAFGAGTFGAAALGAAVGLGGALLVNALTAPKAGGTNAPDATQDQIYTASVSGNAARLGQPLPVWYGRLKRYPDFAAAPWSEFRGGEQFVNVLLSVTMGRFAYEAIYNADTLMWDPVHGLAPGFAGVEIALYEPGQQVTLFPSNVSQSSEVNGQQLPSGGGTSGGRFDDNGNPFGPVSQSPGAWLGGFTVNPAGTEAYAIAIDWMFPGGCCTINQQNGQIGYSIVTLTAEYAPCDDSGVQTGPYSNLFTVSRKYAAQAPVRDSGYVPVAPGRYLVRFRREDSELSGKNGTNMVMWATLRAYLIGDNSFPDVSTCAIRIKASQTTQGGFKLGVLGTRMLPVWDGAAFVTQPTRNPLWAKLDAAVNAQYGSGLPISKVDFNAIVNSAAAADARSDTFDYCFTTAITVPEAFDKILTVARSRHFWLGDTVSVVRDEWRDVPTMLLTDREIVRDSTGVSFQMLGDEDPDAVVVEYVDEETWLPAEVQYPPDSDSFESVNAEPKRIDGIVNRDQAYREAAFYYLQSIYRRESVEIQTEYEGRAITYGSVLRLQSELPDAYGYGGAVVEVDGAVLTLDPPPVWDTGPFYIRLRRPNGKSFGPVRATMGADAAIARLDATSLASAEAAQSTTLAAVLAREDGGEYPSFELGTGVSSSKLCVVLNGAPNSEYCTLSLVVDDERVHAADLGAPPVLPVGQFPANDKLPLIVGLTANFSQGAVEPKLSASWFPTAGAVYYVADATYDDGQHWQNIYEASDSQLSAVVSLAALTLRVQAVLANGVKGPYSTVSVTAPTLQLIPQTVALQSLLDGLKFQVTTLQDKVANDVAAVTQQISSIVSALAARGVIDKREVRYELDAVAGDAKASILELKQVVADDQAALALFRTEVSATFGPAFSSVKTVSQAVATLDGYAAASWSVTLNANGAISGIGLVNGGAGMSDFVMAADHVQIQLPGYNGDAPYPLFTTGLVGSAPSVGINGNLVLNGTLTARMIGVGEIQAMHLAADSIDATKIKAGSISTGQIAVGGVDLINIIDGAVSNTQAFNIGAASDAGGFTQTIANVNMLVRSGKARMEYAAQWQAGAFNYNGNQPFSQIDFIVDGVVVRSFTWLYNQIGTSVNFDLQVPAICLWTVTGLSNGTHNFQVRIWNTGARWSITSGQLYITDFRR
jgi:hypothetical protein